MRISKIDNQPNFKANFAKDSITQYVLREVRRSAKDAYTRDLVDSSFNVLGLIRKNQTLELSFAENSKILASPKPKNFWDALFGKHELFEQQIVNGDVADAFVRLSQKISRLW